MADRRAPDRAALADLGRLLLGHLPAFRTARLQDVATRALRAEGSTAGIVGVLNASLTVRRELRHALMLRPRRAWSRLRFALDGGGLGTGAPCVLSLLCPTRGRVGGLTTFLRSLCRTAVAGGRVEVLLYVDDDDPDLTGYQDLLARAGHLFPELGRCVLHVGPSVGVPGAWNALAAESSGDLLLMANDDQLYVDHGWDAVLDRRATELTCLHPDGVLCLYFDAGQYPEGSQDFPIVTRAWWEALGYFTPTIFQQWEVERWIFDVARRIDRLRPVPGILVEHRHYQDYKAPFDSTYQRHRLTREKSLADHALFLRTGPDREREADVLRAVIAAAATGPVRPADLWFTHRLAQESGRMAREVERMLMLGGGSGPDGRPVASERVALFEREAWTGAAHRTFPVVTELVGDVAEAIEDAGSTVEVLIVRQGRACVPCGVPDPHRLRILHLLRPGAGAGLRVDGVPRAWAESEQCVVLPGDRSVELTNDTDDPFVVLSFAVPRPGGVA